MKCGMKWFGSAWPILHLNFNWKYISRVSVPKGNLGEINLSIKYQIKLKFAFITITVYLKKQVYIYISMINFKFRYFGI